MAGTNPTTAADVNNQVGTLLRRFVDIQTDTSRFQAWLAAQDLKLDPYLMSDGDEANIKTAINGLNTDLQAIDRTFIDRLTGLWQ